MMNKSLYDKFPQWTKEDFNAHTILTDDFDSLIGCAIAKEVKGWEINQFYSFSEKWAIDKNTQLEHVGVDLSIPKGKTFDNHVMLFDSCSPINPESANLNNILGIHADIYGKKYAMSTTLMMWSLYDIPLPKSEIGKMFLIALDVGHKGHYSGFREVHNEWLEKLGFTELIDLLNKYDKPCFDAIVAKIKENGEKITIDYDGFLKAGNINLDSLSKGLGIKIELPEEQFTLMNTYRTQKFNRLYTEDLSQNKNVYSFALAYKNSGIVSYYN